MIFSDFLCRKKHDESDSHEIMPISSNLQVQHARYYNIHDNEQKQYVTKLDLKQRLVVLFYQKCMV